MEHEFTQQIQAILRSDFGEAAEDIFEKSELLQYLNIKAHVKNECNRNQGRLWIGLSGPTVTRSSGQGCPSHRRNRIQSCLGSIGVLHFLLT